MILKMKNDKARALKPGSRLLPIKGRISSNGHAFKEISHMKFNTWRRNYWNDAHLTINVDVYKKNGTMLKNVEIYCDSVESEIFSEDSYDIFECK